MVGVDFWKVTVGAVEWSARVNVSGVIEQTFKEQSGQIRATLISTVRDFALAEDALQDAVVMALQQWTVEGSPT